MLLLQQPHRQRPTPPIYCRLNFTVTFTELVNIWQPTNESDVVVDIHLDNSVRFWFKPTVAPILAHQVPPYLKCVISQQGSSLLSQEAASLQALSQSVWAHQSEKKPGFFPPQS